MVSRYYKLFMALSVLIVGAVVSLDARRRLERYSPCNSAENCKSSKKCQCYCSGIGGFRDKTKNDKPVYVENDSNGVHCYCKQWDLDAFPHAERPADQPQ